MATTPQPKFTRAQFDATAAAAHAEGVTAGVAAERERFMALAKLDGRTKLSSAFGEAVETGTSPGDFAIELVKGRNGQAGAAGRSSSDDSRPFNRGEFAVKRLRGQVPGLPGQA